MKRKSLVSKSFIFIFSNMRVNICVCLTPWVAVVHWAVARAGHDLHLVKQEQEQEQQHSPLLRSSASMMMLTWRAMMREGSKECPLMEGVKNCDVGGSANQGIMGASLAAEMADDMQKLWGMGPEAEELRGFMAARLQRWIDSGRTGGSEFTWDTTGQEEVLSWLLTLRDPSSNAAFRRQVVEDVLAYTHLVGRRWLCKLKSVDSRAFERRLGFGTSIKWTLLNP